MLSSTKIYAQNQRLDSLAALLSQDVTDSLRYQIYSEVIWANHRDSAQYALGLTEDYMDLSRKNKNDGGVRSAHYYYGVIYKNTGDWKLALEHLDTVYKYSEEVKDTNFMSSTAYQLGVVSERIASYKNAVEYYNKNIELNTILKRPSRVATTWNSKAKIYRSMKLYDLAFEHYNKALDYYLNSNDSIGMANVYNNLGNTYSELDSFELALDFYGKQEAINLAQNNVWGMGYVFENRGRLFEKMGEYKRAITSLEKSSKIRRNMGHQSILAATLITLSSCELKLQKYSSALKHSKEAISIAQNNDMSKVLKDGYAMLSKAHAALGQYPRAYQFSVFHDKLRDSLLNEKIADQTLKIDALTDVQNVQKEQQIELLSASNEIKDLRLENQRRNLIYAFLGIFGVLGFAGYFYRSRQKTQALNDILSDQKEVITKSLKEKEFLLKEIHHRVKNNLQVISSLLKLQSRSVKDAKAQRALDEGRSRVRSMALIHQNLYQDESNLGGIKIKEYIDQLISELIDTYKVNPNQIVIKSQIEEMNLDVDTVVPIGLILNELITNSLKYAFPNEAIGEIKISLSIHNDHSLSMNYQDSGIGYLSKSISKKSFGLRLIRSFAERLNAKYELSGANGSTARFIITDYKLAA